MHRFLNTLDRASTTSIFLLTYILIIVLGWVDYITGAEISLSFFYLIPIALVVWKNGKRSGIFAPLISTVVWFGSNRLAGDTYSRIIIFYWNAVVRAAFFLTTTFLLAEIRVLLEQERILSRTDTLTGVLNRRAFYEFITLQFASLNRFFRVFTVIYLDIDNFKNVNDQLGHLVGDQVLQTVSSTALMLIRASDRLVRLGGDEFLIYLSDTGSKEGKIIVTRLLETLRKTMKEQKWSVSFSMGMMTFLKIPDSIDEMVHAADTLMYTAKKGGKNQVCYGFYE